jgi:hypothetical protein
MRETEVEESKLLSIPSFFVHVRKVSIMKGFDRQIHVQEE